MTFKSPIAYLRTHWAGQQGLGWSFWVNLVALRAAISFGHEILSPSEPTDLTAYKAQLLALGVFVHVVVLVWQVVGVLRAGEQHIRGLGSVTNTWGAQLGILVAFWVALSDMWGVWILTLPVVEEELFTDRMDREHASRYELILSDDGTSLIFSGDIELGVTKAVTALIAENPLVQTVVLTSDGGNIFEARGLVKLVRDARLDTRVSGTCSSACTVVFIGGLSRQIEVGARLGFHQYRVDAGYSVTIVDPRAEEARDRALFEAAGVAEWFLDRAYLEPPENIWFPSREQMQDAGVITAGSGAD